MFALAGPAAAQGPDVKRASALPSATAVGAVVLTPDDSGLTYEVIDVSWTVPNTYWANCQDGDADLVGTAVRCATPSGGDPGDETPLTGFVVHYSDEPFDDARQAGVMPMPTSGGTTALVDGKAKYELKGLMPETRYYVSVAAVNGEGTGELAPTMTLSTAKAPKPAAVTGVAVEPGPGEKMLTVMWDEANPDSVATRTNLKITKYQVRYAVSQTATALRGEWMPEKPMEVMGDATTTMIDGLMNDVSYDVQVRAVNNAGGISAAWSADTPRSKGTPTAMTPTPALPLFGAFGLGVGLLAAGRARMRQRRQALLRGRR